MYEIAHLQCLFFSLSPSLIIYRFRNCTFQVSHKLIEHKLHLNGNCEVRFHKTIRFSHCMYVLLYASSRACDTTDCHCCIQPAVFLSYYCHQSFVPVISFTLKSLSRIIFYLVMYVHCKPVVLSVLVISASIIVHSIILSYRPITAN